MFRDAVEDDAKGALTHRDAGIEAKGELSPHKLLTEEARKQHLIRKGAVLFSLLCHLFSI